MKALEAVEFEYSIPKKEREQRKMKQRNHLEIRDAVESEYALIKEVTQVAYEEYATVMPKPFWEVYWLHVLATLEEKGHVERIVAVDISGIVGSVLLYPPLANAYDGVKVDTLLQRCVCWQWCRKYVDKELEPP